MSLHFCNDLAHTYLVLRGKKIQIYKKILTIEFSYMKNVTCSLKLHGRGVKGKYMYVLFTWREVRKVTNCVRGLEYNPRAKAHFFSIRTVTNNNDDDIACAGVEEGEAENEGEGEGEGEAEKVL